MKYPHQWEKLDTSVQELTMNDFFDVFRPCLPHLEELEVSAGLATSSGAVGSLQSSRLKRASFSLNVFPDLFNSGILKSITNLTLYNLNEKSFLNHDTYKKAFSGLPHMLSQLPCLCELRVRIKDSEALNLADLPRVHSTSLHSLRVDPEYYTGNLYLAFLNLFSNCRIDYIAVKGRILHEVVEIFRDAKYVSIKVSSNAFTSSFG